MFCPQCGTNLVEGSRFCYRCGCRLADYIPELREFQFPGTGPRQVRDQQQAATRPAGELAPPESARRDHEDVAPDEFQDRATSRQLVILIDLSHKERVHEDHWSSLRERLREEGRLAIRTGQPVNPALLRSKQMLLIGGPEHRWVFGRGADRWQDEEVRAIERFVARGNALWVMGDGLCDAEALSELTAPYGIRFCADPIGAVTISEEDVYRHRLTRGVNQVCLGSVRGVGGNYLKVEEPAAMLAEHNGRPVMAYCEHKLGRVLVLSSLSTFSERHIGEQDNSALLDNILRHMLRFVPPEQVSTPSDITHTQPKEPAEAQPYGSTDRSPSHQQAAPAPGLSTARGSFTRQAAERTTYGADIRATAEEDDDASPPAEFGAPSTEDFTPSTLEDGDEYLTEPDQDETDEWDNWEDAER